MLIDKIAQVALRELSDEHLPGTLQATFVPDRASIAWWGVVDLSSAPELQDLPDSEHGSIDLALPIREGSGLDVRARRVRCLLTDLPTARAHLPEMPMSGDADARSASVGFWRTWASSSVDVSIEENAARAAGMPVSAHCALTPSGDHIATAAATLLQADNLVWTSLAIAQSGVVVQLRPYQAHGVAWLEHQAGNAGGGILADEMGLGKTVQAICLLASRAHTRPHLIICPTSVLGNWRREFSKFAPTTSVRLYHGPSRNLADIESGVVITSYTVARTDRVQLSGIPWDVTILDEAQQIKNPDAQISRAVRSIPSAAKIAMTGTPVENRLDELWAILNVTNPSILGDRTRFKQRFATPIERRNSQRAAARLNAIVAPHILRRTKKEVAPELPPKVLIDVLCTLTDEQRSLYQREVDRSFDRGLGSGIERHGRVLALLTSLKQICNHPAQFLKDDDGPFEGRSGKSDRLIEMLTELDETDHSLIFTQYRETGDLLATHLSAKYRRTVPFLHGGLTASRRDHLIQTFQDDEHAASVLIVSLRAAGFGINLTRANNIVHFDRWWNPAVEDQATDRAHRIGQGKTLTVYSLVTEGTIEDHIVAMHKSKRNLAGIITGESETPLAKLADDALLDIISLDRMQPR